MRLARLVLRPDLQLRSNKYRLRSPLPAKNQRCLFPASYTLFHKGSRNDVSLSATEISNRREQYIHIQLRKAFLKALGLQKGCVTAAI